jgi:murein DD-endopeptidase MepM/ murein hydrolase activator NlpD
MKIINNQHGFAHAILVLVIVVVAVGGMGFVAYKNIASKEDTSTSAVKSKSASNESDLALENVGLASMDSVFVTNDALREYDSMGLKGFYPFGDKLGGKTDTRLNPNFEFSSLKTGTKVISAIDGVVAFIKEQPGSGDSEVFIQPKDGSIWTVGYDHISSVAVKKGELVKAGDVIGDPAVQGNGALRFEIQINKDVDGETTHVCPSTLLDEVLKTKLLGELSAMQQSWNTVSGINLYDVASQNPIGCVKQTMTPAEAEGR